MSAESGISTFRDANGLWEGHDIMEVASPMGWSKNPELVLDFYNKRRRQLLNVVPNKAHLALAELENDFDMHIITQNVDNLHERAGSSKVLHLHGELLKARSTHSENLIYDWTSDLNIGDLCENGMQLRPHIVWFGEAVTALEEAAEIASQAEVFVVIGTSLQVYPAAGLLDFVPAGVPIYYIDPKPAEIVLFRNPIEIIAKSATQGIITLMHKLNNLKR
ncbi:MAG TPA: Sir2 family NAD-dependent protein deacetylase [Flavobacteriaceae bacterium]|nr:Sir2 family NAD-dependent protein deacetylase [Flavobacteriaceae bacterium]